MIYIYIYVYICVYIYIYIYIYIRKNTLLKVEEKEKIIEWMYGIKNFYKYSTQ